MRRVIGFFAFAVVAIGTTAYAQPSAELARPQPVGQQANHIVKTSTNSRVPVMFASAINRYRFYNREWWYWTPQNYWMYFRGGQWIPYNAAIYRAPAVIVNRTPYYYGNGYYGSGYYRNYGGPGYSYYRPGYRNYNYYGYRPGYSYYRGPYGNPYYSRNPDVRAGANIGGAIGGPVGADVGARVGAGVGRARR
jgi:hypothetical protein